LDAYIKGWITKKQNSLLVQFNNDEAMARAVERLVEYAAMARQLVSYEIAFAPQFGKAAVVKKWKHLFDRLGEISTPKK